MLLCRECNTVNRSIPSVFRLVTTSERFLGFQEGKVGLQSGSSRTPGHILSLGVPINLHREEKQLLTHLHTVYRMKGYVPEDFEELINLRVSVEKGPFHCHLSVDTSHTPHIHRAGVAGGSKQHLRGSIPECYHLSDDSKLLYYPTEPNCTCFMTATLCGIVYLVSVGSYRYTKGSTKSKVSQFYGSIVVDEQVLWFQVSVQHTTSMTELYSLKDLVRITL